MISTPPGEGSGRGRPREVIRRPAGQGTPLEYRPADYPATTRAILDAAHRVLLREGAKGLTLVAVAREAHVDVTTVSYHFGTRHGLIEALMDHLYAEPAADFAEAARQLADPPARWHAYLQSVRRMYADQGATRAYFDIAALALREPALRRRLAALSNWTTASFTDAMGVPPDPAVPALAALIYAAVDGIELHHALAGDEYPLDQVLQLLEHLVLLAQPGQAPEPPS